MEINATIVSFLVKMLFVSLVEDISFKSVTIFNFGTISLFSVWFDCQHIISKTTYNFLLTSWIYIWKIAREFMWLYLNVYFPIREYCTLYFIYTRN